MPFNSFENYPMSWKPKLEEGDLPLYHKISNQLEHDIEKGIILPGTKLPPQRELADYLDINVSTISRAFKICAQKGLLSGSVGDGTYVSYNITTNIFEKPDNMEKNIIELGSMTPETVPQDEMIDLLDKMMKEPDFRKCFQYMNKNEDRYRSAARQLLVRAGCPTEPEEIMFANGGQNSIASIFAALFSPGDRIGVDPFVYPGLKSAAKLFGIQLVPIAQKNGEMSEKGLNYAIKNEAIKGIYVMPDFQNPTTHIMSSSCRKMIARVTSNHNILVIEDGINSLLSEVVKNTIFSLSPKNVIFILSLSKTINPALRLAYLSVPKNYQKKMADALYNINLSQSALLLELASRLILSGRLEELLTKRRQGIRLRNQLTDQILAGFHISGNSDSLNRWLILPNGITGTDFEQMALKRGVSIYGSERFVVGKEPPIGAVRIAICAPGSMEELKKGLMELKSLLQAVVK